MLSHCLILRSVGIFPRRNKGVDVVTTGIIQSDLGIKFLERIVVLALAAFSQDIFEGGVEELVYNVRR